MSRILITAATIAFGFTLQANAQVDYIADAFVTAVGAHFVREGYQDIDISATGVEVTVKALRDGYVIETVYDARDGELLFHEAKLIGEDVGVDTPIGTDAL